MQRTANMTLTVLLALASGIMTSCNAEDDKVFTAGGAESKPSTTLLEGVTLGGDETSITKVASATFLINVLAESEAELCAGEVSAEIMSNLTFKLPNGNIKCASLEIDLTKVLGGAALGGAETEGGEPGDKIKMIEHDGKVLLLKEIMGARFDPPRPMLIGPIIQDASKYEGYDETFQTSLEGIGAANAGIAGSGSFNVKVIDTKTTYKNKHVDEFENVIHWTMTKKGFDGVPATVGALFDSFEFYWNTRPIMIPKVIVKGKLGDLIKSDDPNAAQDTNDLVGVLTISLTIKEYDFDGD